VSATVSLFPHRVADRITLRLSGFEDTLSQQAVMVCGPPISGGDSDGDQPAPVYTLTVGSESWSRLSFDIEARLALEQLTWALPPRAPQQRSVVASG
jgi:hypothetical protein